MSKIVLASSSPRRRELLEKADVKFSLCIKNIDETIPEGYTPEQAVEYLAKAKAQAVSQINEDAIIIGADTIVVLDDKVLGKPKDEEDALRMLLALSDKEHEVITGVSLVKGKKCRTFHAVTKVKFYEITYSEALRYIKTGEPMDKAGAYGIQGKGCVFVESINGDFYNVVGLPIAKVVKELKRFQEEG